MIVFYFIETLIVMAFMTGHDCSYLFVKPKLKIKKEALSFGKDEIWKTAI